MSKTLTQIDQYFADHYRALFDIQQKLLKEYHSYAFDLNKTEITEAVFQRMMSYWYFHVRNTKELLERNLNPTAADFFTETCMLFFKAYFQNKYEVLVCSEKSVRKSKNAVRPDLSIWDTKGEELIAAIELKINDGWKKSVMAKHLENRGLDIKGAHPKALFYVVFFWDSFPLENNEINNSYISLYKFERTNLHTSTGSYLEDLMKQIEQRIESRGISKRMKKY